jgi:DnaJ-class molecular chaperone
MNKDYYKILGVEKSANKDEVKKAFRKLAHQYHPDKSTGDEAKFKEVNEAYSVLSDDKKRAQYDQFGSGAFNGGFGGGAGGFSGFEGFQGGFDFSGFQNGDMNIDLNDILNSFFGGRAGGGWSRARKGRDIRMDIEIDFKDSVFGLSKELNLNHLNKNEKIKIDIPPGMESGEMIRVRGKGENIENGQPGDLFLKIYVKPHKYLVKDGYNLYTEQKIKLSQAIAGDYLEIDLLGENLKVKIPPGINNGEILRVREKGIPTNRGRGNLLIKIFINMPDKISKKTREAIDILKKEGF